MPPTIFGTFSHEVYNQVAGIIGVIWEDFTYFEKITLAATVCVNQLTQSRPWSRWGFNIPLVRYIHAFTLDRRGCRHVVLTVTVIIGNAGGDCNAGTCIQTCQFVGGTVRYGHRHDSKAQGYKYAGFKPCISSSELRSSHQLNRNESIHLSPRYIRRLCESLSLVLPCG
jgi:hypothetical protein